MTRGSLLLTDFLKARRFRRSEFASLIGKSRPLITMWCNGTHRPGPEHRSLIRKATHGLVPVRSWDEPSSPSKTS